MSLALIAQPAAAEDTVGGFFGFKKFIKKNAAEKVSKKNEKSSSDTELTEEEKKQVREMAGKIQTKGPALGKANTKIPVRVISAPPPKVPKVVAQNAPLFSPPKNPNAVMIRPPKPPSKAPQIPQVPETSGPNKTK